MRSDFEMVRTKKQIAFDGVAVYDVHVDRWNYDAGMRLEIIWDTNSHRSQCGYNSILPVVLPPSGSDFTIHVDSDAETATNGADWTTSDPLPLNFEDPENGSNLGRYTIFSDNFYRFLRTDKDIKEFYRIY